MWESESAETDASIAWLPYLAGTVIKTQMGRRKRKRTDKSNQPRREAFIVVVFPVLGLCASGFPFPPNNKSRGLFVCFEGFIRNSIAALLNAANYSSSITSKLSRRRHELYQTQYIRGKKKGISSLFLPFPSLSLWGPDLTNRLWGFQHSCSSFVKRLLLFSPLLPEMGRRKEEDVKLFSYTTPNSAQKKDALMLATCWLALNVRDSLCDGTMTVFIPFRFSLGRTTHVFPFSPQFFISLCVMAWRGEKGRIKEASNWA